MASLLGKTAIITGAYGQIGFAISKRFAQEGASIVLLGRDQQKLDDALGRLREAHKAETGVGTPEFSTIVCDVAKHDAWAPVTARDRPVDILVNCAGISQASLLTSTDDSHVSDILATNLRGAIWGSKYVGKRMMREKKGCIVNVSSLLATKGTVGTAAYAASKAGLLGLTTSLANEYGRFGIRVNAILPGYIDTNMIHDVQSTKSLRQMIPLGRLGTVDEVADAAAFLAKNEYANNCILKLDGGLSST